MKNGCPNQASKQLKPNGQMERMVKMTKKDQGERGMEKNPLLPPDRKPYMVTNSLWQRAMWQRLETRNPCTQYQPHKGRGFSLTCKCSNWNIQIDFVSTLIQKSCVVTVNFQKRRRWTHHCAATFQLPGLVVCPCVCLTCIIGLPSGPLPDTMCHRSAIWISTGYKMS